MYAPHFSQNFNSSLPSETFPDQLLPEENCISPLDELAEGGLVSH